MVIKKRKKNVQQNSNIQTHVRVHLFVVDDDDEDGAENIIREYYIDECMMYVGPFVKHTGTCQRINKHADILFPLSLSLSFLLMVIEMPVVLCTDSTEHCIEHCILNGHTDLYTYVFVTPTYYKIR